MQITIFQEITTASVLESFAEKAESYTDLYVDMNDKDQRKFVKGQADDINSILKKLDRARIDKTKESKKGIDDEFNKIVDSLNKSNMPFTLLIDEYKAERKRILDEEKAVQKAKDDYYQMGVDHSDAIKFNKLFDLEAEQNKKTLYWYHAESDCFGTAKNEKDLMHICNSDGLAEPCSEEFYYTGLKNQELADAEARRLNDVAQAIEQQKRAAIEDAERIERERIQRESDVANTTSIMTAVKLALIQHANLSEQDARAVTIALKNGLIAPAYIKF